MRIRLLPVIPVVLVVAMFLVGAPTSDTEIRGIPLPATPEAPTTEPAPSPTPEAAEEPRISAERVTVRPDGFFAWALVNRATGQVIGSANRTTGTNSTESMIKAWIAADYLQGIRAAGRQPTPSELELIHVMINVSDNDSAEHLYRMRGRNDVVQRMIDTCGLTGTRIYPFRWSYTRITARDAATMGACIADKQPAGPQYTELLLNEMRNVAPDNDFGIPDAPALADETIAVKNGWTDRNTGNWHLNCLGLWDHWSLSVLTRYPSAYGQQYGVDTCAMVAEQLFGNRVPPPERPVPGPTPPPDNWTPLS